MSTVLVVVHVLVSIFLIAVVLLQRGKGAEIGAVFGGGGGSTVFGSRGAGNFLTKLTTGAVVLFMLTSITLSYFGAPRTISDIVSDAPAAESPGVPEVVVPESTFPEAEPVAGETGEAPTGFEAIPSPAPESEGAKE